MLQGRRESSSLSFGAQVMRHERASVKADIWSYGVIIWELVGGQDITECQPLALSKQLGDKGGGKAVSMPSSAPAVARALFNACTRLDPSSRPTAQQVVEMLRADQGDS